MDNQNDVPTTAEEKWDWSAEDFVDQMIQDEDEPAFDERRTEFLVGAVVTQLCRVSGLPVIRCYLDLALIRAMVDRRIAAVGRN